MTFTVEMGDTFTMPDESIPTETARNLEAAYFAIEQAACPYAVIGRAAEHCPPEWVTRQAGRDRYETAAAVSRASFDAGAPVAYVATGQNFPDALAGGVAAGLQGGPLLLVRQSMVPPSTAAELDRLRPARIVVLGGSGVVSDAVAAALDDYTTGEVTRLSGADRYATAAAVSRATFPGSSPPVAFIATGQNFPDGLAAVPAAVGAGGPLLLVRGGSVPDATATELGRLRPGRIVILGGTGVVSEGVAASLRASTSGDVTRIGGADRYATAAQIARAHFAGARPAAYLATGVTFADALSGGPAAGIDEAPVLLVRGAVLPAATAAQLGEMTPSRLVILGGTGVIPRRVAAAAAIASR
jgi:putative cell wall-binding protein